MERHERDRASGGNIVGPDQLFAEGVLKQADRIEINTAPHRVTAEDIKATLTQPPLPLSAMDGYAVRFFRHLLSATIASLIGIGAKGV